MIRLLFDSYLSEGGFSFHTGLKRLGVFGPRTWQVRRSLVLAVPLARNPLWKIWTRRFKLTPHIRGLLNTGV